MPSSEFEFWRAYDRIDPIGPKRGDMQAGIVASVVCGLFGAKKGLVPTDYVLKFERVKPKRSARQTPEEMAALLRAATLRMGGEVR